MRITPDMHSNICEVKWRRQEVGENGLKMLKWWNLWLLLEARESEKLQFWVPIKDNECWLNHGMAGMGSWVLTMLSGLPFSKHRCRKWAHYSSSSVSSQKTKSSPFHGSTMQVTNRQHQWGCLGHHAFMSHLNLYATLLTHDKLVCSL